MTRDLLTKMLSARTEFKRVESRFELQASYRCELLLGNRTGAPVPLPKIERVELCDDYLSAVAGNDLYCFQYEVVVGFKLTEHSKASGRAGFLS